MGKPGAFPPELWELFLQSNFTARQMLPGLCEDDGEAPTVVADRTMREWRPRVEGLNLEAR